MKISATTVVCVSAATALGQATTDQEAARELEGIPAPAIERFDAPIDGWWQDAVFYEIFVRSFADSTTGPLAGDGIGDFRGMIEKLDYLNDGNPETDTDLGVTALWLMPINPSPSYHGYDVIDYYGVNPEFGTMRDLKELLAECEQRGIRVIIDLVLNHSSDQNPWFQESMDPESPKRDWYVWVDEKPEWKGAWGQPVWYDSPADDGSAYFGLFWSGMPDLNYRSEGATEAAYDVTRYWLEEIGVHGFRLDAIRHLIERGRVQENTPETHEWLANWFEFKKSVSPEAFSVGEVWSGSDDISRYVGDQMDVAFEFPLGYTIIESVLEQTNEHVMRSVNEINALYPTGMYATFIHNHDQARTATRLLGDIEAAKLAAAIQFAMPGVPFIYYGEELAALGDGNPHETVRRPMPWTAESPAFGFTTGEPWYEVGKDSRRRNVERMQNDQGSILNFYKRLIDARAQHEILRTGAVRAVDTGDARLMMLERVDASGEVGATMLFNMTSEPQRVPRELQGRLAGEVIFRNSPVARAQGLPPRGAIFTLPASEEEDEQDWDEDRDYGDPVEPEDQ